MNRVYAIESYWPLRWRGFDEVVHLADGVKTRCQISFHMIDHEGLRLWTPIGMPQDATTCIVCLGWTPRT